jgi:hypothetical protein
MTYFKANFEIRQHKKHSFIHALLKWVIIIYLIPVSAYLFSDIFSLLKTTKSVWYEWSALLFNLLLILVITRQLLKLTKVKYIIITDDCLKYSQYFPWDSKISWNRFKQIQFGYSNVRFITKGGDRYRFPLSKITEQDQSKLFNYLDQIARKFKVDLQQPIQ